jgi:hypothetical protein
MMSQHFLRKRSLKPSGLGALSVGMCLMTVSISSVVKGSSRCCRLCWGMKFCRSKFSPSDCIYSESFSSCRMKKICVLIPKFSPSDCVVKGSSRRCRLCWHVLDDYVLLYDISQICFYQIERPIFL